ncbi:hypothetical protein E9531_14515 [Lampropedia puyangensis]|uniref:Uncharacterized protein n=1 Tax=Lampropedia puyangensis TaxID=1330072 RepID=A0A4S8EUJ3_9BURK|nr:hypothetical protein [Lampropedia puyangensis]THT98422.1 hypothetical protein E9531_14515 [Lampropedia puyangensis]
MLETYFLIVDALGEAMSALVKDLYEFSPWIGWIAFGVAVLAPIAICLVLLIDIIRTAKRRFWD